MPKLEKRNAVLKPDEGIALIPLGPDAKHGHAIVDIEDAWVDNFWWTIDSAGYAVTNPFRAYPKIYMHYLFVKPRKGYVTDHINRDVKDNRRSNLRRVSHLNNMVNKGSYKTMRGRMVTSQYKGVSLVRRTKNKPWQYALHRSGERFYGYTETEKEAALEYNKLARKYHGQSAVLNEV